MVRSSEHGVAPPTPSYVLSNLSLSLSTNIQIYPLKKFNEDCGRSVIPKEIHEENKEKMGQKIKVNFVL
jgi:hypothetical protein